MPNATYLIIFIFFVEAIGLGPWLHSLGNPIAWSVLFCFLGIFSLSFLFPHFWTTRGCSRKWLHFIESKMVILRFFLFMMLIIRYPFPCFWVCLISFSSLLPCSCSWNVVAANVFFVLLIFFPVFLPPLPNPKTLVNLFTR